MNKQTSTGVEVTTRSAEETRQVGELLGRHLGAGALVGIDGTLGAGKTVFVQGLALGLGVPAGVRVKSPTYSYVYEYQGRLPLYHVDLYRVTTLDDLEAIGYRELWESNGVCAVEWFGAVPEGQPSAYLAVRIEADGDTERRISFESVGGHAQVAVDALRAGL